MKDRKGKQSPRQIAFEEKCRGAGIPYDLVRSAKEVGELLRRKRKGVTANATS
nr:MAG TPA: hydrolase [Caudoviricetes sp.]